MAASADAGTSLRRRTVAVEDASDSDVEGRAASITQGGSQGGTQQGTQQGGPLLVPVGEMNHNGGTTTPTSAHGDDGIRVFPQGERDGAKKECCAAKTAQDNSPGFECNICFETASEPCVPPCGHLFCWVCLFRWLRTHPICPVCKSATPTTSVIPIYARGAPSKRPRDPDEDIPKRPEGQRREPTEEELRGNQPADGGFQGFQAAFGLSPLFGFQYIYTANGNGQAQAQAQVQGESPLMYAFVLLGIWILRAIFFG